MTAMTVTGGASRGRNQAVVGRQARTAQPVDGSNSVRTNASAASSGSASTSSSIRLTRRGRLVLGALAVGLAIGAGSIAGQAAAGLPADVPVYDTTVVQSGDTLWGIATSIAEPGDDIRDLVAEISSINGLSSVSLVAGDELKLPA